MFTGLAPLLLGGFAMFAPQAHAQTCTNDALTLACDTYYPHTVVNDSLNEINKYTCTGTGGAGTKYPSAEDSWSFTPPSGQSVVINAIADDPPDVFFYYFYNPVGHVDVDLLVTDGGCAQGSACTKFSLSDDTFYTYYWETVQFTADGGQYYVNLDSRLTDFFGGGFAGYSYQLDVDCAANTCDTQADITSTLTCTSDLLGQTTSGGTDTFNYYSSCGSPYANVAQANRERVYSFTPQATGSVTFRLDNMSTDNDLYVLDDLCAASACLTGSTVAQTGLDSVTFNAVLGHTYYIVVEAYGGDGFYDLHFDAGAGGCKEDCDDSPDEDGDGLFDCLDPDCFADPICNCDVDADTYDAIGGVCGGNDCNDNNAAIHPNASESCNLVDDDCDSSVDEGVTTTYYRDFDGDNFGDPNVTTQACSAPLGYVASNTDCDDTRNGVHPGATETCNLIDDNCASGIDEGVQTTYYKDNDADTYGNATGGTTLACSVPATYSALDTDCNDGSAAVHPGATEICNTIDDNCVNGIDEGVTTTYYADDDADNYGRTLAPLPACSLPVGYAAANGDCLDTNPNVYPGATEYCNGLDDDCDGTTDENNAADATAWYLDFDADAFGNAANSITQCTQPAGRVPDATDCNDNNGAVHPGAAELCNGVDDNCVGGVDEGVGPLWYRDADDDGHGNASDSLQACNQPSGRVASSNDCNDADPVIYGGATEICDSKDNDCDTLTDEGVTTNFYLDADSDGYGLASNVVAACSVPAGRTPDSTDCNDGVGTIHPNATELCNGVDDDCDTSVDENVQTAYYLDFDSDGYGDPNDQVSGCTPPVGRVPDNTDCNDTNGAVHPTATETCNGIDDNCNSAIDEGVKNTYYADTDGDGRGDPSASVLACSLPANHVANSNDCDDTDPTVYLNAPELCDNQDNDCDSVIDDGATTTWYRDADGDNFGTATSIAQACTAPNGYVGLDGDCNDAVPGINPGATEICNGIDDDCDTQTDESSAQGAPTWYADDDIDGYGDPLDGQTACTEPTGRVSNPDDCDDTSAAIHPNAGEICNTADDDCDGQVDEGVQITYYHDLDGDNYGDPLSTTQACSKPTDYASNSQDCDDTDGAIHPGATEVCNTKDDNCNTLVDENVKTTFYADDDDDTFGDPGDTALACSVPSGFVGNSADCDDALDTVHPGAPELCNSRDDDCDGFTDESATNATTWYRDFDLDLHGNAASTQTACTAPSGYVDTNDDCDDNDGTVYPGAVEVCDGIDNDCDTFTDEDGSSNPATWYVDGDNDNYGEVSTFLVQCSRPAGYVNNPLDCNDLDPDVHPNADEFCNGDDDDCDTQTDEGAIDAGNWYLDGDSDNWGKTSDVVADCTQPSGRVPDSGDCNDGDSSIHPTATEVCDGIDEDCDGTPDNGVQIPYYADTDADLYGDVDASVLDCTAPFGYVDNPDDCDDIDTQVNPAADEYCNGYDDDCDGQTDEIGAVDGLDWYADTDSDGYGDPATVGTACSPPPDTVDNGADCDDALASVNPAASELCNGIDDDCDTQTDEDGASGAPTWYFDGDFDTFGTDTTTLASCSQPSGYEPLGGDCADSNDAVHPNATELCNTIDDNCDGTVDEPAAANAATWFADTDSDNFGDAGNTTPGCSQPAGYLSDSADCDDGDPLIHPGADEHCDGEDENCDGNPDESAVDGATWYADADSDNYGDLGSTTTGCTLPTGYVGNSTDCDDTRTNVHPGATERCNGRDDDCDGPIDEGAIDATPWYADADGDTHGDAGAITAACSQPPNTVANAADCDDNDPNVHPGVGEVCNGIDDNCAGGVDEGVTTLFYADTDDDGHGDPGAALAACNQPSGYVPGLDDCDDTNPNIFPGADEYCNTIDDDCDATIDEDDAVDAPTWYADADDDYFGDQTSTRDACVVPSGYVPNLTDCNDADPAINPAADELCNGTDDDCDGATDEDAVGAATWYGDIDRDRFGNEGDTATGCTAPPGYIADATDCDDTLDTVNPGATEYCNLVDDDCDGVIDEPDADDASTWYADTDGDGYGDANATAPGCTAPVGFVPDRTDCDDRDPDVSPADIEICNGKDDDCDGTTDESDASGASVWHADADGDSFGDPTVTILACDPPSGFVADATDCDDGDRDRHPTAVEVPYDGIDQDCDGADWIDVDGDGYIAEVVGGDDCNDRDATMHPGAPETPDGRDEDCDGIVDDGTDLHDDDGDGATEAGGDCDDTTPTVGPTAVEVCNSLDDDCDGVIDEDTECSDDDGDGATEVQGDCADDDPGRSPGAAEVDDNGIDDDCDGSVDGGVYDPDGDGYTEEGGDCDQTDISRHPGADEVADGVDQDCDGIADEGTEAFDDDGDGWTEVYGDCDDADAAIHQGADEVPGNGRDDDCDGVVDEGTADADDDGDGYTENGGDCDDFDLEINPESAEIENGRDDDCDGLVDEGFEDADSDGWTVTDGDCDDSSGWSNPGIAEFCDGLDNNCNGTIDESCDAIDTDAYNPPRKCACASTSEAAAVLPIAFLLIAFGRRRRP